MGYHRPPGFAPYFQDLSAASLAAWQLQRLEAPFKVVEVKPSDVAFDARYPLMFFLN